MRFMAFFDASSGAYIDGEIGSYCGKGQAETSLLKKLLDRVEKKSILVLDKFFTNYELRKEIIKNDLNYVIRARDEFAKKILKKKNDVELDELPAKRKNGETMKVRYIKSSLKRDGLRDAVLYIVTNLLKEDGHSKEEIEELYLKRWFVELDIRNLKQTLEAKKLRSKSAALVKKELWVHMISYNLIKGLSNQSCNINKKPPRKQEFKIYIEALLMILTNRVKKKIKKLFQFLSSETLNSKYRRGPRAVRFRNCKYEEMKMSRKEAKKLNWGKSGRKLRQGLSKEKAL